MSSIALKAVIVAGTGTGKTFDAYNLTGNLAIFREVGASATPGLLQQKRTEPKPTKDYVGVSRGEVKLTRTFVDALGTARPAILRLDSSLPAFLNDAQRVAFVEEGLLAFIEQTNRDVLSKQIVAQS